MAKKQLLFTGALLAWLPLAAQVAPAESDRVKTTAEIRIELPEGAEHGVAVEPGNRRIRVELPRGSVFPMDFAASSGGLLRAGKVTTVDGGRLLLELELAVGVLDRVSFEPGALVLRFLSRFEASRGMATTTEPQYRLGPDDRLAVTVHNHPELSSTLTVTRDGTITAPLVGEVEAAGLTPRQLATRLAELLGRSYLVDPQVDVAIDEFRSQWVMVTGEVRLPGRIPLRGGTRLKEVLSEAGGFTATSGEEITISSKLEGSEEYATRRIRRAEFESGEQDPVLRHGDIIEVSESSYCYIQGEVRSPSRVPIERGLTLLRALSMVGGLTEWADLKKVRILDGEGRERLVNLKRIQEGKAEDPPLGGGEVVIVKRRFF